MTAREEAQQLEAKIAECAQENPAATMLAILSVLVDVACGDNSALRDFKRKQLYAAILNKLEVG